MLLEDKFSSFVQLSSKICTFTSPFGSESTLWDILKLSTFWIHSDPDGRKGTHSLPTQSRLQWRLTSRRMWRVQESAQSRGQEIVQN